MYNVLFNVYYSSSYHACRYNVVTLNIIKVLLGRYPKYLALNSSNKNRII